MDIRKFLKKDSSTPSAEKPHLEISPSASTPTTKSSLQPPLRPSSSTRNKRKEKKSTAAANVMDEDDVDEEDFQPKRRRRSAAAKEKQSVRLEEADEVADVGRKKKGNKREEEERVGKKRGREGTENAGTGFGGGGDVEEESAKKKKKKWVPRTDTPPNRGNKELPVGKPDCLAGKVFVITGVLDSLLREECTDLCKEYGARVVGGVSKKVTHGIVGSEPGESKMKKLKEYRIPVIDEDGLFEMIRASLSKKGEKETVVDEGKDDELQETEDVMDVDNVPSTKRKRPGKRSSVKSIEAAEDKVSQPLASEGKVVTELWVDKYKPADSSQLVANPKAIKDLKSWLETWKSKFLYGDGHSWKLKDRGEKDYAAALLVGAPGIGKTTAAHIVCKELGFEPHEFNASDIRNKGGVQMLAETVMVANTISKYLSVSENKQDDFGRGKKKKKVTNSYPEGQVLIMDEVDGMSAGDRGGSQELIKMIKTSRVPIICIANDDSTPNMRSLAGSCFKIRFRRPMVAQVSKRLMEIARREGFRHLQDQTVNKLAEGCNGDIRQMINLLQTWRTSSTSLSFGQVKQRLESEGKTVIQRSIFELAKGFFTPGVDRSQNSLISRTDNFFADSDIMPLFIQENYINTVAASSSLNHLADAAESIAEGDLCNSLVRQGQRWDLMPATAVMSAILPGSILAGGLGQQPQFPSYLGNLSKGNKWKRIVQGLEMKVKAVHTTTGSVRGFRLDYIPAMTTCLATPLIRQGVNGVDEVIDKLDAYYLERDPDWLEILDAGVYGKGRSPMENISGAAKTGLTRAYNAREHRRSTVTGMRVGVKQAGVDFTKTSKKAAEEVGDVGVVDDDDDDEMDKEEEIEEKEEKVEDVMAEFGAKGKKKNKKGGKSGAKVARSKGGKRGKGRRRG